MKIKELVITKNIMGVDTDIQISIAPQAYEAIEFGWDSLAFASNDDEFITVKANGFICDLVTNGEVCITKNYDDGFKLTNEHYSEIRELVKTGQLNCEDYNIDNNNWFAILTGRIINENEYHMEDDILLQTEPRSIEELINIMIESIATVIKLSKE